MADPFKVLDSELADYRRQVAAIDEKIAALQKLKASSNEAILVLERLQAKLNEPDAKQAEGNGFHPTSAIPPPQRKPYPAPKPPLAAEPTSTAGLALQLLAK
ncbi:MAG TPA: hypothetical protein VND64_36040, partial [Pirellulales bacterium]|nr:hypothetical protein [Pirellulales bacterium]